MALRCMYVRLRAGRCAFACAELFLFAAHSQVWVRKHTWVSVKGTFLNKPSRVRCAMCSQAKASALNFGPLEKKTPKKNPKKTLKKTKKTKRALADAVFTLIDGEEDADEVFLG